MARTMVEVCPEPVLRVLPDYIQEPPQPEAPKPPEKPGKMIGRATASAILGPVACPVKAPKRSFRELLRIRRAQKAEGRKTRRSLTAAFCCDTDAAAVRRIDSDRTRAFGGH